MFAYHFCKVFDKSNDFLAKKDGLCYKLIHYMIGLSTYLIILYEQLNNISTV